MGNALRGNRRRRDQNNYVSHTFCGKLCLESRALAMLLLVFIGGVLLVSDVSVVVIAVSWRHFGSGGGGFSAVMVLWGWFSRVLFL